MSDLVGNSKTGFLMMQQIEPLLEKLSSGFLTSLDSNQPVQLQRHDRKSEPRSEKTGLRGF